MSMLRRIGTRWSCFAVLAFVTACEGETLRPVEPAEGDINACANIEAEVEGSFDALARLVASETYRTENFANEEELIPKLQAIYDDLEAQVKAFNEGQKTHKLEPVYWREESGTPGEPKNWWVFGFRLGTGPYKVALSSHFDTVAPGSADTWDPFTLKKEKREIPQVGEQDFWVGRGAIDDKGPALVTFQVLKAIAKAYDGSPLLDHITVELIFDTSEETSMSMPHYLEKHPDEEPDLAVIFDAVWCVRAEKGIERPVFTIARDAAPTQGVWIDALNTPPGPTNQIPDRAEAILRSDSPAQLEQLASEIATTYESHEFDDPAYRRAKLTVDTSGLPTELKLITEVSGAQHGSAPHENRAEGTNPLVSLTNFLASQVEAGVLVENDVGRMARFVKWIWGTRVFGESHADLLQRDDEVFTQGNGTTYAMTRFDTEATPGNISLRVDIRYAMGHHSQPWDGTTEGFLCGDQSVFPETFTTLVDEFNSASAGPPVTFETRTAARPDIRLPEGPTFGKVSEAYRAATGEACPAVAIGGGTDAKGQTRFLAAGALFSDRMGPPINFHGINEGAPIQDLTRSAKILCSLVDQEIKNAETAKPIEEPGDPCGGNASRERKASDWFTDHEWR